MADTKKIVNVVSMIFFTYSWWKEFSENYGIFLRFDFLQINSDGYFYLNFKKIYKVIENKNKIKIKIKNECKILIKEKTEIKITLN